MGHSDLQIFELTVEALLFQMTAIRVIFLDLQWSQSATTVVVVVGVVVTLSEKCLRLS